MRQGQAGEDVLDEWQMPRLTFAMRLRAHPCTLAGVLIVWCLLLRLGQLATTIWWLYESTLLDLILCVGVLFAVAIFLFVLAAAGFLLHDPVQAGATFLSLILTGIMVLDLYCAVSLLIPVAGTPTPAPASPPGGSGYSSYSCSCWEILHLPASLFIAGSYLAEAFPQLLRAEYSKVPWLQVHEPWLQQLEQLGQSLNGWVLFLGLYLVAGVFVGSKRACAWGGQPPACASSGLLDSRGFVLGLHALGKLCTVLLCITEETWRTALLGLRLKVGRRLLPLLRRLCPDEPSLEEAFDKLTRAIDAGLAGLQSPTAAAGWTWGTIFSLVFTVWTLLLQHIPMIRRAAPPKRVVEVLIALRRVAPFMAPSIPVIRLLEQSGWYRLQLLLGMTLLGLLYQFRNEACTQRLVPDSSSMRLWLIVPNLYIDASTQRVLGYTLVTAKYVRRIKTVVQAPLRALPWARRRIGLSQSPD